MAVTVAAAVIVPAAAAAVVVAPAVIAVIVVRMWVISPITRFGIALAFAIRRDVHVVVPTVRHEIHRPAAGAVIATVSRPVFLVAGRYPQIDRFHVSGAAFDDDGAGIDQCRAGEVADIQLSVEARLSDADRDPDVGGLGVDDFKRKHR